MNVIFGHPQQDDYIVVPYISTHGPDSGKEYILFIWKCLEFPIEIIHKMDVETGEFTELEFPEMPAPYTSDGLYYSFNTSCAIYNAHDVTTIFCRGIHVFELSPSTLFHNNTPVRAEIELSNIYCGNRFMQKAFKSLNLSPCHSGLDVYFSTDGNPAWIRLEPDVNGDSYIGLSQVRGYILNLRLSMLGGGAGFFSGVTVEFEELENNRSLSYVSSRKESIQQLQNFAPLIVGGKTSSFPISHGLPKKPAAVFASGEGGNPNTVVLKWDSNEINMDGAGTINAPIHWMAVLESNNQFNESFQVGEMIYWLPLWVFFELQGIPTAFLVSRMDVSPSLRANPNFFSTLNCRLNNVFNEGLAAKQLAWGGFWSDNTAQEAIFHCGSVTGSSSGISHGYTTTPKAIIVSVRDCEFSAYVDNVGSSTFDIVANDSGVQVDWVALK